ncbi:MAG: TIGR04283 family arsenosugar biosynthesis glycosyltransferase [Solirubrobacteraceae bacterium]
MSPSGPGRTPLVTVVVPTLNEAAELPAALDRLAALPGRFEVIVADGGSGDGTAAIAEAHPLAPAVVEQAGGRARQLNAAAAIAAGDALVFLHADTALPRGAHAALCTALRQPEIEGGNFALRFGGGDRFSRILTAWYAVQRRLGVYYGDSVLWVRRETFAELGGFTPLPIMDDYDFVRRLERRGRTACLRGPAVTSARRWQQAGLPRTLAAWVAIRWLYLAGVPADRLARLYRPVR